MVNSINIRPVKNGYITTITSTSEDHMKIETRDEAIFTDSDQIKNWLDTYMKPKE